MSLKKLTPVGAVLFLTGCAVTPDYTAPSAELADTFLEGAATAERAEERWWKAFSDQTLNTLVERGHAQNLDIRTAVERINEAQAVLRGTGVAQAATGNLTGQTTRSGGDGMPNDTSSSATLNGNFVFDIFGGNRRAREGALAQLDAAQLDAASAQLAFQSSIVSNYIEARYFQEALAVIRQTITSREETLDLVRSQRDAGTETDLSVAQAQALLDEARASLPALETGFYSSVYAIATLLAEPVQPLIVTMQRGAPQPRPRGSAQAGVPADLLRNRPDVRANERLLATAVAAAGVAEAQLYPSLSLDGMVTAANNNSWSFGPVLSLPVFNRAALRSSRDQAISQAAQAELAWRASVLNAVEEVQAAQSAYLRALRSVESQRAVAQSYERVVALSRQTYEGGAASFLDLLDAERSLAGARMSLAEAVRDQASSWAALQIAAGRGWQ